MYKRLELHNHTNESDAVFTCKELTDFMVADHVDAFSLTDHNTISGHYKIENYLKEHPQPIAFIPGMEYTTYYGHILCLNPVSYTHLDVYKRQAVYINIPLFCTHTFSFPFFIYHSSSL